ncbi:hypothetical protein H7X87_04490 [Acetobacteraceae bacterium]|nr:hypothetical protein [Candidatus Parcubacteria bacterium]
MWRDLSEPPKEHRKLDEWCVDLVLTLIVALIFGWVAWRYRSILPHLLQWL